MTQDQAATHRENKPLDRFYDVFLSHRSADRLLVEELYDYIENELHFDAYVDWKDSLGELDRGKVDRRTADSLRTIMRHASSFLLVIGEEPRVSDWTPWELGFFDGRQSARRIGVYLPDGVSLPAGMEYLQLYGSPVRREGLQKFLEEATMDFAAMDSVQEDQILRHVTAAVNHPVDYALSLVQWQFGVAANLLTRRTQEGLLPDGQPSDEPLEPAALVGPTRAALRKCQGAIRVLRQKQYVAQRALAWRHRGDGGLPSEPWLQRPPKGTERPVDKTFAA